MPKRHLSDSSVDHASTPGEDGSSYALRLEEPDGEKAPAVFRETLGRLVSGHSDLPGRILKVNWMFVFFVFG